MHELKILLAQRVPIDFYPPVINQAEILKEIGEVLIIDTGERPIPSSTSAAIGRHRVGSVVGSSGLEARLNRGLEFVRFVSAVRKAMKRGVDILVGFEPEAASAILNGAARSGNRAQKIIHLHEFPSEVTYTSGFARRSLSRLKKRINLATMVVVPDEHRADWVYNEWGLERRPFVVMNCPRKIHHLPSSRLIPWLRERDIGASKIVHYQGAVGPSHGIEGVIRSIPYWPRESIFIIVGPVSLAYRLNLEHLAHAIGVGGRMFFVGVVPYTEVLSYAVGASVGVSLLDPRFKNWEFCAGAGNKRFEYIALGIPQVTTPGPGIDELFVEKGVALTAKFEDSHEIGARINFYLKDQEAREDAFRNGRDLHLRSYNYERQYEPVLRSILAGAGLTPPSLLA